MIKIVSGNYFLVYQYWEVEPIYTMKMRNEKLEQARLQKIQKENSDKQTYLSDFKSAFEGLDYQALTGFYDVLRSDIDFSG